MCKAARGRAARNEEMINRILMNAKHRMMFALRRVGVFHEVEVTNRQFKIIRSAQLSWLRRDWSI